MTKPKARRVGAVPEGGNGAASTADSSLPVDKPKMPRLDPLEAAQERERLANIGNRKLSLAVDVLRSGLETVVIAEMDNVTRLPTTTADLRKIAIAALNRYSDISGQSWRRHKIVDTRVGDRDLSTLEE